MFSLSSASAAECLAILPSLSVILHVIRIFILVCSLTEKISALEVFIQKLASPPNSVISAFTVKRSEVGTDGSSKKGRRRQLWNRGKEVFDGYREEHGEVHATLESLKAAGLEVNAGLRAF